jgi:hypothetical protein
LPSRRGGREARQRDLDVRILVPRRAASIRFDEPRANLGPVRRRLLEEERHARGDALVAHAARPRMIHRAESRPALTAYNHPRDAAQVERAEVLEERLDREEAHEGRAGAQRIEPREHLPVLDARAEPDALRPRARPGRGALRALRQNLIDVRRGDHDLEHAGDEGVRDVLLVQVGHRVDEHAARLLPAERLAQALRALTDVRGGVRRGPG